MQDPVGRNSNRVFCYPKTEKMETYFGVVAMIVLLFRFMVALIATERERATNTVTINAYTIKMVKPVKRRYKMKLHFTRRIRDVQLFSGHYVDAKALYALYFDRIPCVCFIGNVDANKVFDYIREKFNDEIFAVYQHLYFDHDRQEVLFNNALFVMAQNRIIEAGTGYVHVLYEPKAFIEVKELITTLAEFKVAAAVPTYQTKVVGFAREPEMN